MQALVVDPGGTYVDGTFGRGGHSRAILSRLGVDGRLIGLDRDPDACEAGRRLAEHDQRFRMLYGRFSAVQGLLAQIGVRGPINGCLLDLGVSSPQLDVPERGFSFSAAGPLDLRMDPTQGESAAQWLARAQESEIARVLFEFGEERFSRRIARAIVTARGLAPLETTTVLAGVVARAVPTREPGKHPATRTFQALRIVVNDELNEVESGLSAACELLAPAGRLVVISFHSLEDRIVKRFMRNEARGATMPKGVPLVAQEVQGRLRVLGKPVRPGPDEVSANPRARSAIMRVAERLS